MSRRWLEALVLAASALAILDAIVLLAHLAKAV